MKKITLFFILIFNFTATGFAAESTPALVHWDSPEGIKRLERSTHKIDFFKLSNQFEPQTNKIYCGLASSVIVLNALRLKNTKIQKPKADLILTKTDRRYLSNKFNPFFERYTQKNILKAPGVKSIEAILGKPIKTKDGKTIQDFGLQLRQLHKLLTAHGLKSTLRVANDPLSESQIRKEWIENLNTPNDYVLINYLRSALGQDGGGHISPLAAYDDDSDSFLVLDVNPNKADWVWVKTKDLLRGIHTKDTVENRGYLLIKEGP